MKTILIFGLLLAGSFTAWNIHEIEECHTWHSDVMEHHISVAPWQIEQCKAHNVKIVQDDFYVTINNAHFENGGNEKVYTNFLEANNELQTSQDDTDATNTYGAAYVTLELPEINYQENTRGFMVGDTHMCRFLISAEGAHEVQNDHPGYMFAATTYSGFLKNPCGIKL